MIGTLRKELDEYKRLYETTRKEYNKLIEQKDKREQFKIKGDEKIINHQFNTRIIEIKNEDIKEEKKEGEIKNDGDNKNE